MKKIVYVKILGEGTLVYRPVSSIEVGKDVLKLEGEDIFDPEDEEWEFLPGCLVKVEEKVLEGEKVLVAIARL